MHRAFAVIKGWKTDEAPAAPRPGSASSLCEARMGAVAEIEQLNSDARALLDRIYAARKANDRKEELQLAVELINLRMEIRRRIPDSGTSMDDVDGTGQLLGIAAMASRCIELSEGAQKEHFAGIMREAAAEHLRLRIRRLDGMLAMSTVRPYLSSDEIIKIEREERERIRAAGIIGLTR